MNAIYFKIKSMRPLFVVDDLERSLDFYTLELGFTIGFRYEDFYAGINRDIYSLHLKCGSQDSYENDKPKNKQLELYFSVDDLDSVFESMKRGL